MSLGLQQHLQQMARARLGAGPVPSAGTITKRTLREDEDSPGKSPEKRTTLPMPEIIPPITGIKTPARRISAAVQQTAGTLGSTLSALDDDENVDTRYTRMGILDTHVVLRE